MNADGARSPVTPRHRARAAYLYIRQSTLRQVHENTIPRGPIANMPSATGPWPSGGRRTKSWSLMRT